MIKPFMLDIKHSQIIHSFGLNRVSAKASFMKLFLGRTPNDVTHASIIIVFR